MPPNRGDDDRGFMVWETGIATAVTRIEPQKMDGCTLRLALEPVHPIERVVAAPSPSVDCLNRVQGPMYAV